METEIKNLKIEDIQIDKSYITPKGVISIDWSTNRTTGRYELILGEDGLLHAFTESMDHGSKKDFTKEILKKLADKIVIES